MLENSITPPRRGLLPPSIGRRTRLYVLIGFGFGLVFPIIAMVMAVVQANITLTFQNFLTIHQTQPLLWIIDIAPIVLGLFAGLAGFGADALEARNQQLIDRENELTSVRSTLEERVDQRTRQVVQRNLQMQAAVDATRRWADIHDLPELLTVATESLEQAFRASKVDIYLLDETGAYAGLAAFGKGGDGRREHHVSMVPVGDSSIIGEAAAQGRLRISSSTDVASGQGSGVSASEVGPDIALPLSSRGRVLGVLNIQPTTPASEQDANIQLLRLMADQLAASIDSSRSFDETRNALRQLQQVTSQASSEGWQRYLSGMKLAFQYSPRGIEAVVDRDDRDDASSLRVPLKLRGQKIGAITLRRAGGEPWTDADRDLAENATAQVALALENIRLLEETRQSAFEDQRISEISARFASSTDIDSLIQTAVKELAALPEVSDASIFLNPGSPVETLA